MGITGAEVGYLSPLVIADAGLSKEVEICPALCEPCVSTSPVPAAYALTQSLFISQSLVQACLEFTNLAMAARAWEDLWVVLSQLSLKLLTS